jgi:molybdopterin-guanine dinucleotide biosynthesis protein A
MPKATLLRDAERLVDRSARVLGAVCDPMLELGPGYSTLDSVSEQPPGAGPLAAVAAGGVALRARGHDGAALALAVDLPFVDVSLLGWLATHPASGCVVPRVDAVPQSLCARYDARALDTAQRLVDAGERAMRALLDNVTVTYVDEPDWSAVADPRALVDVDTPEAVASAGLRAPR